MRIRIIATVTAKTATKIRKRTLKNLREMLTQLDFDIKLATNNKIKPSGKRHTKNFDAIIEFLDFLPLVSITEQTTAVEKLPSSGKLFAQSHKPKTDLTPTLLKHSKAHKNHTLNHKPAL